MLLLVQYVGHTRYISPPCIYPVFLRVHRLASLQQFQARYIHSRRLAAEDMMILIIYCCH